MTGSETGFPAEDEPEIHAVSGQSILASGEVVFQKCPNQLVHPASLQKLLTAYVARQTVAASDLDTQVLLLPGDRLAGKKDPGLMPGDIINFRDLFYLLALPSHNAAAEVVARAVGQMQHETDPESARELFLETMRRHASDWEWTGAVIECPSGLSKGSRLTAAWINQLMLRIAREDPWLASVFGVASRTVRIHGPSPRSATVQHTIHLEGKISFPEFVAGKTGTMERTYGSLTMLTQASGGLRSTTVLRAVPEELRYQDMRRILYLNP